jgi:hypothetical protein
MFKHPSRFCIRPAMPPGRTERDGFAGKEFPFLKKTPEIFFSRSHFFIRAVY